MISYPANTLTPISLSANGWIDSGWTIPSGIYTGFEAINKGANDCWASFDQSDQFLVPAGGSNVPPRFALTVLAGSTAKLYLRNAANDSNATALSFSLWP
jgi:hypothetical protein